MPPPSTLPKSVNRFASISGPSTSSTAVGSYVSFPAATGVCVVKIVRSLAFLIAAVDG